MNPAKGKILVYGGRGSLGSHLIEHFKQLNWWVGCVDHLPHKSADFSVAVPQENTFQGQECYVLGELLDILKDEKLNGVVCVAGGLVVFNDEGTNLIKQSDSMWRKTVWPSVIATSVATKFLVPGGLLTLTGARSALKNSPKMVGYKMSKTAVHALAKSLGEKDSGLPKDAVALAIVPGLLQTATNMQLLQNHDSICTPLAFVANWLEKWVNGEGRPPSGSLVEIFTENGESSANLLIEGEMRSVPLQQDACLEDNLPED